MARALQRALAAAGIAVVAMTAVAPDTLAGTASSANLGPAGSAASVASVRPVNGQTVGVGHPIIVTFTHAVADRSAAEQTITVTSPTNLTGHFQWLDDSVVQWIPGSR